MQYDGFYLLTSLLCTFNNNRKTKICFIDFENDRVDKHFFQLYYLKNFTVIVEIFLILPTTSEYKEDVLNCKSSCKY